MFGEKILDYWDDILRDLKEIIAVPSVAVPQAGPYPFGKDAAAAVDKAMELWRGRGERRRHGASRRGARRRGLG